MNSVMGFKFFLYTVILFASSLLTKSTDVSYDGRALKIDGERKIIISGSIHYPRSTAEMWPSLIKNAKEGGLNAIETYVFWNAHEPLHRQYDFTGNLDLVKFIQTIHDEGLYSILRIGPYVCAEWNYGGFPVWLHNIQNMTFRTTNDDFMSEMRTFTTLIVDMMKKNKLFASEGGPIILSQIENEYGNVIGSYGDEGKSYIHWCAELAQSLNTGVPWIMCQEWDAPDPMINTCNGYYCDQFSPKNGYPKMWTENWTGWYKDWGNPDPHRTAEDVSFAVARFYQLRGSLQNYYMYHGGTNFGRNAGGPYIVTSYDYDAPLNEYGSVNQPKWGHLKQLHLLLISMEKILTYGTYVDQDYGGMMYSTVFTYNGTRACFFGNANEKDDITINFEGRNITTPAWSVSIFPDCQNEAYNTARVNVQTNVLEKVESEAGLNWEWRFEPFNHLFAQKHKHTPKGITFDTQLLDQKTATNDTSDYLWYLTNVKINRNDPIWGKEVTLQVHTSGAVLHAFVNNKHIGTQWAKNGQFKFVFEQIARIKHGVNTIALLSGTVGLQNYGAYYEKVESGILGPITLIAPNGESKDLSNHTWGYKVGLTGLDEQGFYLDTNHRKWHEAKTPVNQMFTWYKTTFDTPSGQDPVVLDLEGLGKGTAWVNGNNIGRYWPSYLADKNGCSSCDYRGAYHPDKCQTNCGTPSQKWYHVPRSFMSNDGKNNLVLFEEFGGNPHRVKVDTVNLVKICADAYEGNTLELSCQGRNMSQVDFASFGDPNGSCGAFTKGSCESSNALSVVQSACIGKESCSIDVSETNLGHVRGCASPTASRRFAVTISCT